MHFSVRRSVHWIILSQFKKRLNLQDSASLQKYFTASEIRYCLNKPYPYEHFAARFAAKTAFLKLMSAPVRKNVSFSDVEVQRKATGQPSLVIKGGIRKKCGLGIGVSVEVSLSHDRKIAAAAVLIYEPKRKISHR